MTKADMIYAIRKMLGMFPIKTEGEMNYVRDLKKMKKNELTNEYIGRYVLYYGEYPHTHK